MSLIPLPYRWLALALLALSLFGYGWIKGASSAEGKLAAFTAETRTAGEIAAKAAQVQKAKDESRKAASDASYTKALVLVGNDLKRLRDNAGSSYVPATSADTGKPETACYDRAALDAAIRKFAVGVSELVGEGEETRLKLDNAIRWANP